MALHFTEEELKSRRDRVAAELQASGLAALLIFRQESMYYLTGYDTTGYSQFQCLYLGADGRLVLLTRSADLRQARLTSVIEDIRIWVDRAGVNPGQDLWAILEEQGCRGQKVGVELEAWCLTGRRWEYVRAAMEGRCQWEDQSDLVSRLRLVKSDAEIEYVRRAAALADEAWLAAQRTATAGTPEQDILAAMTSAVFQGGGDYTATRFIIGSGETALNVRNFTGYRTLGDNDQLQLEFGGAYRHYHAALMRTILTGEPDPRHVAMHAACAGALQACKDACRPGATFGDIFQAHADALDRLRVRRAQAQRLRLQPGRPLPANVDGLAHDLPRQPGGHPAQHGHIHAHDPAGRRQRAGHVRRRHRNHHRRGQRDADQARPGPGGELRCGRRCLTPTALAPWSCRRVGPP